MSKRRVVVTGMGAVTPLGHNVTDTWQAILAGNSGVGPITRFDPSAFSTKIGASVKDFDVTQYLPAKEARRMDTFLHYGMVAGIEAMSQSGLDVDQTDMSRCGVMMGSGIGGIAGIEKNYQSFLDNNSPRKISPFFIPGSIINMISGFLSIRYGFQGPNLANVTACTTGTHNIGLAARLIEYGDADVILAGGAEMSTTPSAVGGFCNMKALSTRNEEPEKASRPWDKNRDGFVLGDGAGALILEEYEHAKARGATVFAELAGFGMSADAYHMTSPSENGDGAQACMKNALKNAGLTLTDVDYINAHGTSTGAGDIAECRAIKETFGEHAYKLAVSSTKSMTGHLLGAAGAVEAIFSILAIQDQMLPATVNLDDPEDDCDLDFVPHKARSAKIAHSLSNSFGFGGTNGSLVFSKI